MHTIENSKGTLQSLLEQVKDQSARTQDYLSSTNNFQLDTIETPEGSENVSTVVMERAGGVPTTRLRANDVAFQQIATQTGIDVRTAKRFEQSYPDVLDHAVNRIWSQEPKDRMLRTFDHSDGDVASFDTTRPGFMSSMEGGSRWWFDGTLRAFVSSKFKTFDNVHLLESALPTLMESDAQWKVVNGDITDRRLYLRLVSRVIEGRPAVGDVMALGIGLSNSEVGMGSVAAWQLAWTLACLNGMQTQNKTRSTHVTSARETEAWKLLTDEAKDADNHALSLKTRDVVASFASRESFDAVLDKMSDAHNDVVNASAADAVAGVVRVLNLKKSDNVAILDGLMQTVGQPGFAGRPISRATMVNAVTAVANQVEPDQVDEWQANGSKVLNLPASQWATIRDAEPVALAAG